MSGARLATAGSGNKGEGWGGGCDGWEADGESGSDDCLGGREGESVWVRKI